MMIARPNCLAVCGRTDLSTAPSRRCKCQSSGCLNVKVRTLSVTMDAHFHCQPEMITNCADPGLVDNRLRPAAGPVPAQYAVRTRRASLLLLQCCSCSVAPAVLLLQCCSCSVAAVTLLLRCCNCCGVATAAVLLLSCCLCAANRGAIHDC